MKRLALLLLLLVSVTLTACSSDKNEQTAKPANKEEEKKEAKKDTSLEDLEKVPLEVNEGTLLNLAPGSLTKDLPFEKDIEEIGVNVPEMDEDLKKKLLPKLEELTKKNDDIDTIKKGLVALLASPHYQQVIENSQKYEPQFEEPFLPDPTHSDSGEEKQASKKAIILLDASSSMLLQADGKVKMDIAKDAVKSFAQTIGQSSEVSLVVYGHKGSESDADKIESCSAIEELYPMGKYSKQDFHGAVDSFESKGWTPLAGAIQKASDMSGQYSEGTTIYIVSDGAETCDGDPVQASKTLAEKHSNNSVNIIGFDVDGKTEDQLKAVAEAGNGEYFKADSPEELKNTIQYEWLPSTLDLAWAFTMAPDGWETMDEYKRGEEAPLQLWNIGRRESHRILDAISLMYEKKWITDEQQSQLRDWGFERSEAMKELYYDLYEKNRNKADTKSKEIRQRVDEWVAKMRKLKEERGDVW